MISLLSLLTGCLNQQGSGVIPLEFQSINEEQQINILSQSDIKKVLIEKEYEKGKLFIYLGIDDEYLYAGYEGRDQLLDLGQIGDLNSLELTTIQEVQIGNVITIKIEGAYGANAPMTNYFTLENDIPKPFLRVATGHGKEIDLDDDGIFEIVSQHGTPTLTMVFKYNDNKWRVADVNKSLDALSVYFDSDEKLFHAYYKDEPEKTFRYTEEGFEQLTD